MRNILMMEMLDLDYHSDLLLQQARSILDLENNTSPQRPLLRHPKRLFEYSAQEMYDNFRFTHEEVRNLIDYLQIPQRLRFEGRWFHQEEMIIILLRRLCSVGTYRSLRKEIRREPTEICTCFNHMIRWMVHNHGWLISGK